MNRQSRKLNLFCSKFSLARPMETRRVRRWLKTTLVVLLMLVAAGAASLAYKRQFVVSRAMAPGLQTGDVVAVSRLSYGVSRHSFAAFSRYFSARLWPAAPQRGDVAVVKLPRDGQTDFVLRVIGLPGERVQLRAGRVYINDVEAAREIAPPVRLAGADGQPYDQPVTIETLPGGARYAIMQTQGDQGRLATTPVYEVPADSYFLLADNRDNAVDSRLPEAYGLGFVPFENFVGRADIVLYSLEADLAGPAVASHIRWDRILQRVR